MDGENFFADGQAYDLAMGRLSRIAGERFLEWLSMPASLRWLDVGCGSGSFTELILQRGAPSTISAIDPSRDQIVFAKSKLSARQIDYCNGDAMSLPYDHGEFDVAVMALVIQFIPDPGKAMCEITRVVRKGGTVAAYVWPGRAEEWLLGIDLMSGRHRVGRRPGASGGHVAARRLSIIGLQTGFQYFSNWQSTMP